MAHDLLSRRKLLTAMGAVGGVAAFVPGFAMAQAPPPGPANPLSTVTTPPRDFGPNAPPTLSPNSPAAFPPTHLTQLTL